MRKYNVFSKLFTAILCISLIFGATMCSIDAVEKNSEDMISEKSLNKKESNNVINEGYINNNEDFRGVWISTVYKIDYPNENTTNPEKLKKEADDILNDCKQMGFNAVIFQVRPTSDAFYKSSLFPWSKWISGTEGVAPDDDFDPLEYWVSQAHKKGMEFHAWINPFRVTTPAVEGTDILSDLSEDSVVKRYPDYIVKYKDSNNRESYYINPGLPEARKFIVDGAVEIVKNYDVDGIHIDDYFYPGKDFNDDEAFEKYGSDFSSKDDWRRDNIDCFIKEMNKQIHEADIDVQFGVSPSGIWANKSSSPLGSDTTGMESYTSLYADTRKWASEGWIDYIAPQIYWSIGKKGSDYKVLSDWWSDVVKNSKTKLYIGIADYKAVDAKSSDPFFNGSEIQKQMKMNEENDIIKGEIHFAYNSIKKVPELKNKIIAQYNKSNSENTDGDLNNNQVNIVGNGDIRVVVDGKDIVFDQKPIIENSRTLVPMRAIFEALGATVEWFPKNESITAVNNGKTITMKIGNKNISVNETDTIVLDVAPKIINSRTLVPLRAVSEVFDAEVVWDNNSRTVTIKTKK